MILHNLIPSKLCDGTRLQVNALRKNVIETTIFTGCDTINFSTKNTFSFIWLPLSIQTATVFVKVYFVMTINKA